MRDQAERDRIVREQAERDRFAREQALRDQAAREQQARIQADDRAWTVAQGANTVSGFDAYIAAYPSGRHVADARSTRQRLAIPTYAPYDVSQLHPDVRRAVEQARAAEPRALAAAERGRAAAQAGNEAARRGRAEERGYSAYNADDGRYEGAVRGWLTETPNGYGVWVTTSGEGRGEREAGLFAEGDLTLGIRTNADGTRVEGEFGAVGTGSPNVYHMKEGRSARTGGYEVIRGGIVVYEGQEKGNGHGVWWDEKGRVYQSGIFSNFKLITPLALNR
jgi:hypothetical protein